METITIPLSKKKLVLMLAGSLMFVGLGVWFMLSPNKFATNFLPSPNAVAAVGAAAVVFFGACAVVAVKKLLDTRPGLIISADGIIDNSSGVSGGVISWGEITGIRTEQVQSQRFILLTVTNPEAHIEAQTGALKRRMMKINYRMYGTPVCISANSLQCNFDELYRMINEGFAKYGK